MENKSRYEQMKELSLEEMAVILSWYFNCTSCPARKEGCSDDCSFCMDAIIEWLKQEGEL